MRLLGTDAQVEQQADDGLPIDVVVERAERLGDEERQEAALLQQLELVVAPCVPRGLRRRLANARLLLRSCGERSQG